MVHVTSHLTPEMEKSTVKDKSSKTDITNNSTEGLVSDTDQLSHKNIVSQLVRYEADEMTDDETIILFQQLIDSGLAWSLQGHYGRTAAYLIEQGVCNERTQ